MATLSGAHIRWIEPSAAEAFLARNGVEPEGTLRLALGAFEPHSDLIGVVALGAQAVFVPVFVAVTPARRRLKVGTDLITALLDEDPSLSSHLLPASYHSPTIPFFIDCLADELKARTRPPQIPPPTSLPPPSSKGACSP